MQRDMSYALDGAFASQRNAGQLVAMKTPRTRILRTPGLTVMRSDGAIPTSRDTSIYGVTDARAESVYAGQTPTRMTGLAGLGADTIDIPYIGPVKKWYALLGVVLLGGILMQYARRRRD